MKRVLSASVVFLLLGACAPAPAPVTPLPSAPDDGDSGEMTTASFSAYTKVLYVDPATTVAARDAFKAVLAKSGHTTKGKRELYAQYIDSLGANGILQSIQELWPSCHSEAHALGYVIYDHTKDIGTGLQVCADGCYSGCMHGVLMEAFQQAKDDDSTHVELSDLKGLMNKVCYHTDAMTESYSPGDCAHGIGHAVMSLAAYDVPKAMSYCKEFENPVMQYYCATGAYMEYVSEFDQTDAISKPVLYPCLGNDFPAACTRYKMVHVVARHYLAQGKPADLLRLCTELQGADRIACFHGLGNAHMSFVYNGKLTLPNLCEHGTADDQEACIEGVMERMAKYHEVRAAAVCTEVSGVSKEICDRAVANKMYSMTKDMSLYLQK